MSDEPLPRQRVAVTVFADVEAVDARDGAHIVEQMLYQLGAVEGRTVSVKLRPGLEPREVTVHLVLDAGLAVGNGYMWLKPTGKAFPRDDEGLT